MDPDDVVSCIEGEPYISKVPVEPGVTNAVRNQPAENGSNGGQRIVGMNTENAEINEGLVRFDIIFYVRMPSADGRKDDISQIIVNLEIQKEEPAGYDILNRAVFYVSRMVSSQKERDFVKMKYNDIKRVFSIWICMNMNENSMNYVHLTNDRLLGFYQWKGRLDLLNIVLIGIAEGLPEHDDKYELHRLLNTLFSTELSVDEKLEIMKMEYRIAADDEIREDVDVMCNLSQGIKEKGREEGVAEGIARIILSMHSRGYTSEQIAEIVEKSIDEVETIIEEKEPMMV